MPLPWAALKHRIRPLAIWLAGYLHKERAPRSEGREALSKRRSKEKSIVMRLLGRVGKSEAGQRQAGRHANE